MPKRSNGMKFNFDAIKDADLRTYVRKLSTSLDRQNQELKIQSLKNNIYQKYFQCKDINAILNEIVDDLPLKGYSSLRILITQSRGENRKQIISGQSGSEASEYAYLDEQIIQQLEGKKQLIIPDTAKIHSIKFNPDKKFPKTIYAHQFLKSVKEQGYFWITFEEAKNFSAFELEQNQQIASSLEEVISRAIKVENLSQQTYIDRQALELVGIPVLIIGNDKKIIDSNLPKTIKLEEWVDEISNHGEFITWTESDEVELSLELQINEKHLEMTARKVEISGNKAFILALLDDTIMHGKESYLNMVIDTISHDFRAPLINMQGFTKLLSMVGELNEKQAEYLTSIGDGVENLLAVVEDLADVNRLGSEGGLKTHECETGEVIKSAIALIQAEARQKRIEFETKYGSNVTGVSIDRVLVVSALYNLLKNAVANSRIGGAVIIDENTVEGNWIVSVKDQGKGISQIDIEKLEANHFISKESKGLSIVDQIARFHKGKLSVKSELGRGSNFIFEIPAG